MRSLFFILTLLSTLLCASLHGAIDLPIDAHWGDPPGKLVDWGSKWECEIRITLPAGEPDLRRVTLIRGQRPFPVDFATEIEALYVKGQLVELSLHQRDPKLTAAAVKARFLKEKRLLTAKFGTFKINRRSSAAKNDFSTDSLSYHVEPIPGLFILLLHTEMEDQLRKVREGRFTLVYRNQNLRDQLTEGDE